MSSWNNSTNLQINGSITDTTTDGFIAAFLITAASGPSIFLYGLFVVAVLRDLNFKNNPYFLLAAGLGIADIIGDVIMLIYAAPSAALGYNYGGESVHRLMGALIDIGWFAALPFLIFLAINRYINLSYKQLYEVVFSKRNTMYMICFSYGIGSIYIVTFFDCCRFTYNPLGFGWAWDLNRPGSYVFSLIEMGLVSFVVLVAMTCNGVVFFKYRYLHKQIQVENKREKVKREREFKLFLQFFVITVWLFIFEIPFNISFYIPVTKWFGLTITLMYIVNCSINGWVYFALNRRVRQSMKNILQNSSVQPIAVIPLGASTRWASSAGPSQPQVSRF